MKNKILGAIVALFSVFAISTFASADEIKHGDIMIKDPWARAAANQKVGAGFLKMHNMGEADVLLAAKSDIAKKVEIHESSMSAEGIMRMVRQDNLPIPAGGMVELKPGSFHIMFMKLNEKMTEGEKVTVELIFEKAGPITLELPIHKAGAMKHGHDHSHN
ncbi:copper chaperone PCu(A)C [Curvivirga aplysinae]|uniref:copper chaperone PCu(A)C n=1 Tax=Curvivirga aplysinae TaxID=2529852 RepID=UPI0012BC10EE|nr:copper chaperone PCu(A)C [Curvivirga aplysinae]MTI08325.1 copper chaperone PCu(A)C [Curvivirga aplysinae]